MVANAVYFRRNCAPISFLTLSTFFKNKNRENAYVFVVLYIVFNRGFITGGYIYIYRTCVVSFSLHGLWSLNTVAYSLLFTSRSVVIRITSFSFLRSVLNKLTMFLYYTNDTSCISLL